MLTKAEVSLPKQLATLEKRCDYDAIYRFAMMSDDFNPIHVDREFAAASPMGGIIAHGPMSLGLIFQALTRALVDREGYALCLDVYFRRPVRENDTITAGGHLHEVTQTYAVWVKNQKGEMVVEGQARIVVRPHPEVQLGV